MSVALNNLSVTFGQRRVLANISLDLGRSALIAIMGPSGSGKSTLLGVIAGLVRPTSGQVTLTPGTRIDWIVQQSPLLSRRTIRDNIALGALAVGFSREESLARAQNIAAELGLTEIERSSAGNVSGGERQRAAVARGIAAGADVLLVDEPTASLDSVSKTQVCRALRIASEAGALVIVATHDDEVATACDLIYFIREGRLVQHVNTAA